MTIRFQCSCGKKYSVSGDKAGKTTTCSGCRATLVVPLDASDGELPLSALPPKRKKRKRAKKPKLSSHSPDGRPGGSDKPEMHPLIVLLLAVLLFMNGMRGLDHLIYVPLLIWLHPVFDTSSVDPDPEPVPEFANEESAVESIRSPHLSRVWYVALFKSVTVGLCYMAVAVSWAGVLTWRGYAVFTAVVASILLLPVQFLFWDMTKLAVANLVIGAVIIWLLKSVAPIAWPRLMQSTGVKNR